MTATANSDNVENMATDADLTPEEISIEAVTTAEADLAASVVRETVELCRDPEAIRKDTKATVKRNFRKDLNRMAANRHPGIARYLGVK